MTDVLAELVPLIARIARVPPESVTAEARFDALGNWTSLSALRLLAVIEQRWRLRLDLRGFTAVDTVGELVDALHDELT